jgi:hypothetical protein
MSSGPSSFLNRRKFLGAAAATLVASQMPVAQGETSAAGVPSEDQDVAIPDTGWRLWPDQHAEWKSDSIFLLERDPFPRTATRRHAFRSLV